MVKNYPFHLKNNEEVVTELRKYFLLKLPVLFLAFVILSADFFFMFWLFRHDWWGISIFVFFILLSVTIFFRSIFLWYRNIFFITTHRLIDIEQRGFFDRVISDIPYDQVENVHGRIKGFWSTIFRYGNVNIQTGEGQVVVTLDCVRKPLLIAGEINKFREYYLTHLVNHFSGNLREAVIDKLYELELEDLEKIKIVVEKRIGKLKD